MELLILFSLSKLEINLSVRYFPTAVVIRRGSMGTYDTRSSALPRRGQLGYVPVPQKWSSASKTRVLPYHAVSLKIFPYIFKSTMYTLLIST